MKEIKFRVWNKKWSSFHNRRSLSMYPDGTFDSLPITSHEEYANPEDFIIQQYTGLTDRNGQEIYEGDILTVYRTFEPYKEDTMGGESGGFNWYSKVEQGKVFWSEMTCGFMIEYSGYDDIERMGSWNHRFEVVGNIFEGVEHEISQNQS